MSTIRENFVTGAVQENPLSAVALQLTMAGRLQALPTVVAPDIARLTIDPDGTDVLVGSGREIVHVTAYVEGDPLATIVRGQEGTTPKPHSQGVKIVHADTIDDWSEKADLAGAVFTGPISAPSVTTPILHSSGTLVVDGASTFSGAASFVGAAAAPVLSARVTGDAQNRAQLTADGVLSLGSGAAPVDASMYRDTANRFLFGASVYIGPTGEVQPALIVARASATSNASNIRSLNETAVKTFEVQSTGQLFASGTSSYFGPFAMGGSTVGTRNRLYTDASNVGILAESDAGTLDVGVIYRTKGAGLHKFQGPAATTTFSIDGVNGIPIVNATTGYLDLRAGAATVGGATGGGIGDKIALFGTSYGIGVQSGRIVLWAPGSGTGGVSVRVDNTGGGQHSAGTDAITLNASGLGTFTGGISLLGGVSGYASSGSRSPPRRAPRRACSSIIERPPTPARGYGVTGPAVSRRA
jgi:hypothetical protein